MGIIRKTASISTLGIVSFRSKKEQLRRAEKARQAATSELNREQTARADAERRVAEAEKRVRLAEIESRRKAQAGKEKGKRLGRKARRVKEHQSSAREVLSDFVAAAQPVAEDKAKSAGRRARKAAARAQEEAGRQGRRARARMRKLEKSMAPHVEATRDRAGTIKDDLVERAATVASELKDRAEQARHDD